VAAFLSLSTPIVRRMGSDSFADVRSSLNSFLAEYREREAAGDDMADAGRELADAVEDRLGPRRPCSPNRTSILEVVLFERDLEDLEFIRVQALAFENQESDEVREIHQAIEQRFKDLQRIQELDARNLPPRSRAKRPQRRPETAECELDLSEWENL
jgi:hypothetical protein